MTYAHKTCQYEVIIAKKCFMKNVSKHMHDVFSLNIGLNTAKKQEKRTINFFHIKIIKIRSTIQTEKYKSN